MAGSSSLMDEVYRLATEAQRGFSVEAHPCGFSGDGSTLEELWNGSHAAAALASVCGHDSHGAPLHPIPSLGILPLPDLIWAG